jgi:hypothetical protein
VAKAAAVDFQVAHGDCLARGLSPRFAGGGGAVFQSLVDFADQGVHVGDGFITKQTVRLQGRHVGERDGLGRVGLLVRGVTSSRRRGDVCWAREGKIEQSCG